LDDAERQKAAHWVSESGLSGGYALLNPGAGWPSKLWPADRFAAVARHFGQRWNLPSVVVYAGEQELRWAEQIVAQGSGWAKLAPPTSLRELAALAQRARLFVGSDTGPLHLAVAVGTPCVGLYGPWPAAETGPYGLGHVAVQKMVLESRNSRDRRNAPSTYMEAIDMASVCEACDKILRRGTFRAA
jgi:heptosyltransferase I